MSRVVGPGEDNAATPNAPPVVFSSSLEKKAPYLYSTVASTSPSEAACPTAASSGMRSVSPSNRPQYPSIMYGLENPAAAAAASKRARRGRAF